MCNTNLTPQEIADEQLLQKHCDYIISEYVKAGGKLADADRSITYWTLRGILDREGHAALQTYMDNWKPYIRPKPTVGYAGI